MHHIPKFKALLRQLRFQPCDFGWKQFKHGLWYPRGGRRKLEIAQERGGRAYVMLAQSGNFIFYFFKRNGVSLLLSLSARKSQREGEAACLDSVLIPTLHGRDCKRLTDHAVSPFPRVSYP